MNHLGTRELATERLTLRRFEIEDAENMFYNWANDPEVTKYLTWPAHENVEVTESIVKDWVSKYDDKEFYQWAFELNDLEQPIGAISAVKIDNKIESVEIGYCIGQKFWHKGYATEALTEIIRFFIAEVGAGRVCARHDSNNPNSGKVMAAAGMEYVGILAKLELSPEEAEAAKKDMADMLDYIDQLNQLDTTGIEPMSHVFPVNNVFREDVVTNGDGSEATLANAPIKKDGGFKVPKTIGD